MIKNKKQMFLVISMFALILFLGGTTYAWFNYRSETSEQEIVAGEIYMHLTEGDEEIELTNIFPETKEEARSRDDNYITFNISGNNTSNKTIYYEFDLNHGIDKDSPKIRFNDSDLRFDLVELDSNGDEVRYLLNAVGYDTLVNKRIYVDTVDAETDIEISRKYKLRMWISDEVIVSDSDSNATYPATGFNNYYANIKLSVIGDFTPKLFGYQKVQNAILAKRNAETNSCNPIYIDNMGTANDDTDDITYFSGTSECVDMNYVWYSGKLWRITAIYPDGSMKLVTADVMTSIMWGRNIEYDGSWIYQWLSEELYPTIYNVDNIIKKNTVWNYSSDNNSTPLLPETIETQKTKIAPVGLLNAYEYYSGSRCIGNSSCNGRSFTEEIKGYLNIGQSWWLLNPKTDPYLYIADSNGNLSFGAPFSDSLGIRPAIVIKYNLEFTGDGTINSPYKIVGDKETAINNVTLLNSRTVGEYVRFDNNLYRIVDTFDGITKLTMVDYIRDSSNNEVIQKKFASGVYYGKSNNTHSDDYWDYYLNDTWYTSISSAYKNMMIDGTYYLGNYDYNKSFKTTICKDADLDNVTIANCTKYTSSDSNKTFTGKVGLPRVGEMFAVQLCSHLVSSYMWSLTPYGSSYVYRISGGSSLTARYPSTEEAVRPSITLKSTIKITGGEGTKDSPFEISE